MIISLQLAVKYPYSTKTYQLAPPSPYIKLSCRVLECDPDRFRVRRRKKIVRSRLSQEPLPTPNLPPSRRSSLSDTISPKCSRGKMSTGTPRPEVIRLMFLPNRKGTLRRDNDRRQKVRSIFWNYAASLRRARNAITGVNACALAP